MTSPGNHSLIELLSALVACPSVNATDCETIAPPFGEERLAHLLASRLRAMGACVTLCEVAPGRPNLVALFPGKDRSRSLMLEAHSDVVPVTGMTIAPFDPRVENGRLYGRGACDTKGPMAAMIEAIRTVLDQDGAPPTDLYFVSACDEEHGARGVQKLLADGFRADAAIVGEPTELTITHMHKGSVRWRLTTRGKAAHSSRPETGVNAIAHMAEAVCRINGPLVARLAGKCHAQLGHPTLSVGLIHGGTQVNIVPAECFIEIDRRTLPDADRVELARELVHEMQLLGQNIPHFNFALEEIEYYPPLERGKDSLIARVVAAACEQRLGKAEFTVAGYGTDGGFLDAAGIPSLIFGPGSLAQAHQAVEFIELAQLAQAVDVYADCIRLFGQMSGSGDS